TGSPAAAKMIGMTSVACLAASVIGVPDVTMTSTLCRTNSAAISAARSFRPCAQRTSVAAVRPSIQPSSFSRCTNAANHAPWTEGVPEPKNPIVRTLPDCAGAENGHAAAPPTNEMICAGSFDDLVSASEEHRRHLDAERLGGLEIDHQLIFGRRLHWQLA